MQAIDWRAVRHALVLAPVGTDELPSLVPALQMLRSRLPDTMVSLMVEPEAEAAAGRLPGISQVWVHSMLAGISSDPAGVRGLVQAIRAGGIDAAVIFTPAGSSPYPLAYACYLAGVRVRLGQSPEFGGGVLSHWIKPRPGDAYVNLLVDAGLGPLLARPSSPDGPAGS